MPSIRRIGLLLAVAWATAVGPASALDAGQPVPEIELRLPNGGAQKLADLKGKVVYLDFWASWCGPCKQSFPWMNEMQRKYAARGLQVVAINLDAKRADADQFLIKNPAAFAIAFDAAGESARSIGLKGMPTSLLLGADGKVLYVHTGFRSDERADLEARLVAALGALRP